MFCTKFFRGLLLILSQGFIALCFMVQNALAAGCSVDTGKATINEIFSGLGGRIAFIEIKTLQPVDTTNWQVNICTGESKCNRFLVSSMTNMDPWYYRVNNDLNSYVDFKKGFDVSITDASGNFVDYITVKNKSFQPKNGCVVENLPYWYETPGNVTKGTKLINRTQNDGTGAWVKIQSDTEGTQGANNDGEPDPIPSCEVIFPTDGPVHGNASITDESNKCYDLSGSQVSCKLTGFTNPSLPIESYSGTFNGGNITPGEYYYEAWGQAENMVVNIIGEDGDITEDGTAIIYLKTGGNDIVIKKGAQINVNGDPSQLIIVVNMGSGKLFKIEENATVNAFIYSDGKGEFLGVNFKGAISVDEELKLVESGDNGKGSYTLGDINKADIGDYGFCQVAATNQYQIIHDGAGLTCAPEPVLIRACSDASCNSFDNTINTTVTMQVNGGAEQNIIITDGTSVNEAFVYTDPDNPAVVSLTSDYLCSDTSDNSDGCVVNFAEAGFLLNLNNHQSCATPNLVIKAVRLSDSGLECAPAYMGNQSVDFIFNYSNPNTGTEVPSLAAIDMAAAGNIDNRTVSFNGNGVAELSFNYQDAGQIRINVSDAAAAGLASSLVTAVVSPAKLMVTSPDANADCASGDATCSVFKVAGADFNLDVTAACSDNTVTKNFEMNNIPLIVNTVAPNVGNPVSLGVTSVNIEAVDNGSHNINNQEISEVGVFTITATPPVNGYFGETIPAATSANIGRFIPAAFVLDSKFDGSLQVSPDAPSFAYIGQKDGSDGAILYSLQPDFTIKAVNSDDVVTKNYAVNDDSDAIKDFMTLITTQVSLAPITTDTVKKGVDDTLIDLDAVISGSLVGDSSTGLITFTMDTSNHFTYQHIANSKVDHFTADIDIIVNSINDGEGTLLADTNGVTAGVLKMDPDGVGVRFGRWYIENAYGPETSDLPLPMQIQYWNGSQFITNTLEGLTVYDGTDEANYTKDNAGLSPALAIAVVGVDGTGPTFSSGVGQLLLEKPTDGSQGQIRLTYDIVPAWLQYDWDGDGNYDNNPSGVGTFGLFRGNDRIIYQREVNN